jgi:hypothetical protein
MLGAKQKDAEDDDPDRIDCDRRAQLVRERLAPEREDECDERRLADAQLPAHIGDGGAALSLPQRVRDLLLAELRFLLRSVSSHSRACRPRTYHSGF